MKKALFILFVLGVALASCKKYESNHSDNPHVPVQPTYDVGDYYHNDTLEGVVFYTYGAHSGLMVGLEEVCLPWCQANYINQETGATNPYSGWNNTNIVMSNYDLCRFPVIQWSYLKNTWDLVHHDHILINERQWYVPSSEELEFLLKNKEAVNATLETKGCPTLEGKTYWTSTETGTRGAAAARVEDGQVVFDHALKTETYYVRAIRRY